jgi:hypothetical protein
MAASVPGRPERIVFERRAQRQRSHSRCQRRTVPGCTTIKALRQSGHDLASRIQKSRSRQRMCGRLSRVKAATCLLTERHVLQRQRTVAAAHQSDESKT